MTDQETYNMIEIKGLVVEIANNSPIRVDDYNGETNICMFCDTNWAERNWEHYVEDETVLLKNPDAKDRMYRHIRWEHHKPDCLWVRANKALRGL